MLTVVGIVCVPARNGAGRGFRAKPLAGRGHRHSGKRGRRGDKSPFLSLQSRLWVAASLQATRASSREVIISSQQFLCLRHSKTLPACHNEVFRRLRCPKVITMGLVCFSTSTPNRVRPWPCRLRMIAKLSIVKSSILCLMTSVAS